MSFNLEHNMFMLNVLHNTYVCFYFRWLIKMGWLSIFSLAVVIATVFGAMDYNRRLVMDMEELLTTVMGTLAEFDQRLEDMANHLMVQDLYSAEKLRSEGHSGIKLKRLLGGGTRHYHLASHGGNRVAGIHNHANFDRTMGLGELVAVLNGVEFRTRHNDFMLYQPSTSSSNLHETEDIPFPQVPRAVTRKPTIDLQILEMREWFKAWRDQDYSVRDYRNYFKANLCYLEGAWYYPDAIPVDLIHSDRHHIESPDFVHLSKQFKYTSDSGRKQDKENLSFLPRSVYRVVNGTPEYAQWNYRILCQPLADDLPLNRFRVIDELAPRMRNKQSFEEYILTNKARYQLNPYDSDTWGNERMTHYELLDDLMLQIPGLDNHGTNLTDEAFSQTAYEMKDDLTALGDIPLNAAYYHRWFMASKKGALGLSTRHRGFNDNNMFVAVNTRPGVVPTEVEQCTGSGARKVCDWIQQRFSYAIPMEIVYTTPLSEWNPYNLVHKGHASTDYGKTVRAGGRNGRATAAQAYDGTNSATFYRTPAEFFTGGEIASDPADTSRGSTGVLDANGVVRVVRDSGHRIMLPEIPGVGILRQRFPIMPVFGEGSSIWKEVEALKDIVLDYEQHLNMYRSHSPQVEDVHTEAVDNAHRGLLLELPAGRTGHSHLVHLSEEELGYLENGESILVTSDEADGHVHQMSLRTRGRGANVRYVSSNLLPPENHLNVLTIPVNPEDNSEI